MKWNYWDDGSALKKLEEIKKKRNTTSKKKTKKPMCFFFWVTKKLICIHQYITSIRMFSGHISTPNAINIHRKAS